MGGNRRKWGLIVGLAGAGLIGYSLFTVFATAGCVGAAAGSCAVPGFSVGPVLGMVLIMAGMYMGSGRLIVSAVFMAIAGASFAAGALGLRPEMPNMPWLFGGVFVVAGLLPLFLGVVLRRLGAAKQAMAAELMRTGVRGIGTIVEVGDTGMTINNNPRIVIRMRIEPDDGSPAVERSKKATVSRVAVPQVGQRYPAWFDRADPDKWMFGTDMDATAPAEVKEMFARAQAGAGPSASFGTGAAATDRTESGPVEELATLTALWKEGALTDAEFADAKARLLSRIGR